MSFMKIEIQGLNQIYPNGNHALKDINLEFGTGMFGLLGPNGAGKSSLMRIMVTLMKPSSGVVLVDGKDIQKNRKELTENTWLPAAGFQVFHIT